MFVRVGFGRVGREGADEGDHLDAHGAVIVEKGRQRAHDGEFTTEFLANLTEDGGVGGFAGLDLAPGKFPFEAKEFVRGTLGEQDLTIAFDHGADNGDGGFLGHAGFLMKN